MEDKIKQSFEKISKDLNEGFSSMIALTQFANNDEISNVIKKIEKWQLKTK